LRLAVVTALAEVVVQTSGLAHGYWAVLTIFIVLRPDYSSTLQRGLQRAAGTAIGAGLGICTVLVGRLGPGALLGGIAVSLLVAYAVFTVNYLLYAVFLTDFVVVLLKLLGLPADTTAVYRLIGTCLGTGLAVLAYLLWPTWAGAGATEKFARLSATQGAYAAALLRAYGRPGQTGRLGPLQLAARRARSDAEASADRLAGEPEHAPMNSVTAQELASAGHRIAQATLILGAVVSAHHAGEQPAAEPELQGRLDELAAGIEQATGQISAALRALGSAAGGQARTQPAGTVAAGTGPASTGPASGLRLPPLREQQQAIWLAAGPEPAEDGQDGQQRELRPPDQADEESGLFAATDGLVDAINTTAYILQQ
jgi:uncharacterized membrane protein YccC